MKCPICESSIIYKKVEDNKVEIEICAEYTIIVQDNEDNSFISVECSNDSTHELPAELRSKAISIAKEFGY